VFVGRNAAAIHANFSSLWAIHDPQTIEPGADWLKSLIPSVTAASGAFGLLIAFGVSQVGSLFSADAWNNITFTAGEVKNPRRDVPISLAAGTAIVITLYILANVAYLSALPLHQIQTAPDDRVATATLAVIFGPSGATLMALAIMVSTFGCANGLILAGARVYYAMAQDGLFFRSIGRLNANHVPAMGLVLQGIWAAFLVLLRTRLVDSASGAVTYGNLYGVLLDYVVFAALMFYALTIGGVLVLRRKRPGAERPYRAWGYPVVPVLYIITATLIMLILILYQTQDTWPGLVIVILGVPVYLLWSRRSGASA
jgi:APA family basic amino acid/polyamine antiporter